MAQPPLTYLEKLWSAGRFGSNRLIDSSTQNIDRKNITLVDYDFHRNISSFGRRTLVTLGRWLFWNCDAVRGAVLEAANYATETWIAQHEGADHGWGEEAEDWLAEHNKFCNIRGGNRSFDTYLFGLVIAHFLDGEQYTILTERQKVPKLQVFPSHRIGSRSQETLVMDGVYDGAPMVDGVIVDDFGGPIGYRAYTDDVGYGASPYVDVSANDIVPSFVLYSDEQLRGISLLGASMFNWQDTREFRAFQLIQEKLHATVGLIEQNETGDVDTAKRVIGAPSSGIDANKNATAVATENVGGVSIFRYRAGENQTLESFRSDTPTMNQQEFMDSVIREALHGIGWSWDFSLNPTKAGGAQMRVVVDKINRNLECLRKFIIEPTCRRIDGWRIAKAIKNGWLKENPEWYKWSYQGPAALTADRKYDSDVDIQERRAGLTTLRRGTSKRGEYWRDERGQQTIEVRDLLDRVTKDAAIYKWASPEIIMSLYELVTPNGNLPMGATAPNEPAATEP